MQCNIYLIFAEYTLCISLWKYFFEEKQFWIKIMKSEACIAMKELGCFLHVKLNLDIGVDLLFTREIFSLTIYIVFMMLL